MLVELIDKYGSDKNASGYTNTYSTDFEPIKSEVKSILEIGLGTIIPDAKSSMHDWKTNRLESYMPGASLRVWQEYFPNAQVYGGDIQEDTQFSDDRITTYLFNSQDRIECNKTLGDSTFDIIIDDGDHDALSQIKTAYNLMHRVNKGGYYIIEDITPGNYEPVLNYIGPIITILKGEVFLLEPAKNLLVIKID